VICGHRAEIHRTGAGFIVELRRINLRNRTNVKTVDRAPADNLTNAKNIAEAMFSMNNV